MILIKYRMLTEDGCIETLNEQEAIEWGNYIVVTEEIQEEQIENTIDNVENTTNSFSS